jgi:microcystin degradation protein MlrC
LTSYKFLSTDSTDYKRASWFPILIGRSIPGGIVSREAYESLMTKMLEGLKKNLPYDGVFFDIHGAMSVVGLDDPEGDMIVRIRKVVGYKTIISTSMDLHGNVSWRLAQNSDLITCYRMAPHEDATKLISQYLYYCPEKKRALGSILERVCTPR